MPASRLALGFSVIVSPLKLTWLASVTEITFVWPPPLIVMLPLPAFTASLNSRVRFDATGTLVSLSAGLVLRSVGAVVSAAALVSLSL